MKVPGYQSRIWECSVEAPIVKECKSRSWLDRGEDENQVKDAREEGGQCRTSGSKQNLALMLVEERCATVEDPLGMLWCATGYTYLIELAEKAAKQKVKWTLEEIISEEYSQYAKVFLETESEHLPEHKPYDHCIDLKPETLKTIWSKVFPMPLNEQDEIDQFLEENLHKGYIVPSKSLITSSVFFIKKKNSWHCLVENYRKLNDFTVKNCYPLPLALDIINCLHKLRFLLSLTLDRGTTTFVLRPATSGRQRLPPIVDALNLKWCFSAWLTPQPCFKLLWILSLQTSLQPVK